MSNIMGINKLDGQPFAPLNSDAPQKKSTLCDRIEKVSLSVFEFFEKVLWKCIKETNNITKKVISLTSLAFSELDLKLASITKRLGILSAISLLFTVKEIPNSIKNLIEQIKIRDGEGVAFSVLSLITAPLDALDSIITTTGALAAFGIIPKIALFGLIGLPLAVALTGYAAIKGLYDLIQRSISLASLPKSLKQDNIEKFKTYLKEKVGVTQSEKAQIEKKYEDLKETDEKKFLELRNREIKIIKDRKRNCVSRHTDGKVYNIMKNLKKHLKENPKTLKTANFALDDMKKIVARKITWDSLGVVNNLALSVSIACSAVFPISAFAIPIIGVIRSTTSLGKHLYEHLWQYKGLNLPDFIKVA